MGLSSRAEVKLTPLNTYDYKKKVQKVSRLPPTVRFEFLIGNFHFW